MSGFQELVRVHQWCGLDRCGVLQHLYFDVVPRLQADEGEARGGGRSEDRGQDEGADEEGGHQANVRQELKNSRLFGKESRCHLLVAGLEPWPVTFSCCCGGSGQVLVVKL